MDIKIFEFLFINIAFLFFYDEVLIKSGLLKTCIYLSLKNGGFSETLRTAPSRSLWYLIQFHKYLKAADP